MSKTDGDEVIAQALKWWKGKRPIKWTQAQHLANPTVNLCSDRERGLALAVAEYLKLSSGKNRARSDEHEES